MAVTRRVTITGGARNGAEEWRPIEGYPSYEASSLGRIRSIDRKVRWPSSQSLVFRAGRMKALQNGKDGYKIVHLCSPGEDGRSRQKTLTVHRLVARTFLGRPAPGQVVNHKDGDKTNNSVSNLEWVTVAENSRHAYATGLNVPLRGEARPSAKLTETQAFELRRRADAGERTKILSEAFKVSTSQVRMIRKRRAWAHLGESA